LPVERNFNVLPHQSGQLRLFYIAASRMPNNFGATLMRKFFATNPCITALATTQFYG